jgi:hypothetical protein
MNERTDVLCQLIVRLGLSLFLSGCSHVWVDSNGDRHVIGFVHLTIPADSGRAAAETLRVQTLGLSWTQAEAGSALLLGWGDTTLGFLRNNVCVAPRSAWLEMPR